MSRQSRDIKTGVGERVREKSGTQWRSCSDYRHLSRVRVRVLRSEPEDEDDHREHRVLSSMMTSEKNTRKKSKSVSECPSLDLVLTHTERTHKEDIRTSMGDTTETVTHTHTHRGHSYTDMGNTRTHRRTHAQNCYR